MISVLVLLVVFALIAARRVGSVRLQIWQVMLLGAVAVLATGQISPEAAVRAINLDVMFFLFGMFVVGEALEESGYLSHLSHRMFRKAKSFDALILIILFGMGIPSAFLMNDTLAIIGTPVVLSLAIRNRMRPQVLLLALAFSVTTGSAMSPIGNPQNLLIAIGARVANPFVTFFRFLAMPTMVNLLVAYLMLRLFYGKHLRGKPVESFPEPMRDPGLAKLSQVSLILLVVLTGAKIATALLNVDIDYRLTYIAIASAAPIILLSPSRLRLVRNIDWHTLIFFASMFVLMESVWDSGFFQNLIGALNVDLSSVGMILIVSVLLSQFISNVPLVALYLPLLIESGVSTKATMALAAGSTIAGNLAILGAASNVIIIQNAEKRSGETVSFFEFVRIGLPLTAVNVLVYWMFFAAS